MSCVPAQPHSHDHPSLISPSAPVHAPWFASTIGYPSSRARATHRKLSHSRLSDIYCVVSTPPHTGSFNIVYELSFSNGVRWVICLPASGNHFSPARSRSLHLDIISQCFIASKNSIPLPQIHYNNLLLCPFVIMDFKRKIWNDNNWITDRRRRRIFEQIAGRIAELEFN
jgi:hypothetical protein